MKTLGVDLDERETAYLVADIDENGDGEVRRTACVRAAGQPLQGGVPQPPSGLWVTPWHSLSP